MVHPWGSCVHTTSLFMAEYYSPAALLSENGSKAPFHVSRALPGARQVVQSLLGLGQDLGTNASLATGGCWAGSEASIPLKRPLWTDIRGEAATPCLVRAANT